MKLSTQTSRDKSVGKKGKRSDMTIARTVAEHSIAAGTIAADIELLLLGYVP